MRSSRTRCTWPELSPLRHSFWRERLKYQASPVSMVVPQRLFVHVRDHQNVARRDIGGDARDQAVGVEFGRQRASFLDLVDGAR